MTEPGLARPRGKDGAGGETRAVLKIRLPQQPGSRKLPILVCQPAGEEAWPAAV